MVIGLSLAWPGGGGVNVSKADFRHPTFKPFAPLWNITNLISLQQDSSRFLEGRQTRVGSIDRLINQEQIDINEMI
jgi:hypothetical protein